MGALKPKTVPTQTTTYSTPISPYAQAAIDTGIKGAIQYYKAGGAQPVAADIPGYSGPLAGGISGDTESALSAIQAMAGTPEASLLGKLGVNWAGNLISNNGMSADQQTALQALKDTAGGKWLDPANQNPYLQQQLDRMSEQIQNRVNSLASGSGRYGSGAHTGVMTKELGGAIGDVLSTNWENERNRQIAAAQAWNAALEAGLNRASGLVLNGSKITDSLYNPASHLFDVGAYRDQRGDAAANSAIQAANLNQNAAQANASIAQNNNQLQWQNINNLIQAGRASPVNTTQTGYTQRPTAASSLIGGGLTLLGSLMR